MGRSSDLDETFKRGRENSLGLSDEARRRIRSLVEVMRIAFRLTRSLVV